jgi:hypothetical protein
VATDNGDPSNLESFASKQCEAYFGLVFPSYIQKKVSLVQ